MPPKKKEQPKPGPKAAVDKTFGLKNVHPSNATLAVADRRKTNPREYSNLSSRSSNSRPLLESVQKLR